MILINLKYSLTATSIQLCLQQIDKLEKKPWEEKYSLNGADNGRRSRALNDYFLILEEEVMGSNHTLGKKIKFSQCIL